MFLSVHLLGYFSVFFGFFFISIHWPYGFDVFCAASYTGALFWVGVFGCSFGVDILFWSKTIMRCEQAVTSSLFRFSLKHLKTSQYCCYELSCCYSDNSCHVNPSLLPKCQRSCTRPRRRKVLYYTVILPQLFSVTGGLPRLRIINYRVTVTG